MRISGHSQCIGNVNPLLSNTRKDPESEVECDMLIAISRPCLPHLLNGRTNACHCTSRAYLALPESRSAIVSSLLSFAYGCCISDKSAFYAHRAHRISIGTSSTLSISGVVDANAPWALTDLLPSQLEVLPKAFQQRSQPVLFRDAGSS
jgi:hypothetical protein